MRSKLSASTVSGCQKKSKLFLEDDSIIQKNFKNLLYIIFVIRKKISDCHESDKGSQDKT